VALRRTSLVACIVVAFLASGLAVASAAETGTKTMPDSSVNPPQYHHRPVYRHHYVYRQRHNCAMPSSHCDNNHRVQN
jgi:hypothetical protein